jgi:hypothetical protein
MNFTFKRLAAPSAFWRLIARPCVGPTQAPGGIGGNDLRFPAVEAVGIIPVFGLAVPDGAVLGGAARRLCLGGRCAWHRHSERQDGRHNDEGLLIHGLSLRPNASIHLTFHKTLTTVVRVFRLAARSRVDCVRASDSEAPLFPPALRLIQRLGGALQIDLGNLDGLLHNERPDWCRLTLAGISLCLSYPFQHRKRRSATCRAPSN